MTITLVALVNRSTVVSDRQAQRIATALNAQAGHLPRAGYPVAAEVHAFGPRDAVPARAWELILADTTDVAEALGYHDTAADGEPRAFAFVGDALDAGLNPSVTISHELVEMLVDPWATLAVDIGGAWVAWEACDPVEADQYAYTSHGVDLSDFVLPSWFTPDAAGPYDWMGVLTEPLQLAPGGYVAVQQGGTWTQIMASRPSPDGVSRAALAHRIERRRQRAGGLTTLGD